MSYKLFNPDANRVVCGGCETQYAAAQRFCPLCRHNASGRQTIGIRGVDPEPVEVVRHV